jgi:hypothetical protein
MDVAPFKGRRRRTAAGRLSSVRPTAYCLLKWPERSDVSAWITFGPTPASSTGPEEIPGAALTGWHTPRQRCLVFADRRLAV